MATSNGTKQDAHPGDILLVIHDFIARSPDELSLAKGDRIELIERDDEFGDGWYLGKHMTNGQTGLFPEVYTRPAPKGTLTAVTNRRASEGPSKSSQSKDITTQQRHASTGTLQQRPASSSTLQSSSSPIGLQSSAPPSTNASRQNSMLTTTSPVMNETLSVIDEHITDMSTPRGSIVNGKRDSSIYSGPRMSRMSYIAGHETDEEESQLHSEEEVLSWNPETVAEYLEDHGVEKAHCDVFKEQEITGEVLLAMDQSSIFIKEFDLGPVGRRLKTWHKIKALQDEVFRSSTDRPKSTSENSAVEDASNNANRPRSMTSTSALPRALATPTTDKQQPARSQTMQATSQPWPSNAEPPPQPPTQAASGANVTMSPLQTMTSLSRPENTYRPSAQTIRQMQQNRRHSSLDSTSVSIEAANTGHKKQPSVDQSWQPGQPAANGSRATHAHTMSSDSAQLSRRDPSVLSSSPPGADPEKGYFSSNEAETRTKGRTLTKKSLVNSPVSPMHSRNNSVMSNKTQGQQMKQATTRDAVSPIAESSGSVLASALRFGGLRSTSSPTTAPKHMKAVNDESSPTVTKLDHNDRPALGAITTSSSPAKGPDSESSSVKATPSPSSSSFAFWKNDKNKRAISDAVTKKEKKMSPIAVETPPLTKEDIGSPTKTGSTTPSTETKSFDLPASKSESQSRTSQGSGGNLMPPQPAARKPRPKDKKATSAYTRGLERKTPAEQMNGCDYSGWMKKKSGSLMATWKPRLFVLRGRRLSYYYSDNDHEEKGLIDISFHRVLPAQDEKLTGIHASMTGASGAASSPTSPTSAKTPTMAQEDLKKHPAPPGEDDGLFIFKLVPPKSGLAKGVNFTKPTVHYFAVNSRQEGRLWMAALMKATIDRDENGQVTTTYNQKTISLAKARARKERPPALKEEERHELDGGPGTGTSSDADATGTGLGIANVEKQDTPVTIETESKNGGYDPAEPSTVSTQDSGTLDEKEREAIALNAFAGRDEAV